jgi:hypothetical protein
MVYSDFYEDEVEIPVTGCATSCSSSFNGERIVEFGDKVELFCLVASRQDSSACDSFRLVARAGMGDLPIGIDLALLSVRGVNPTWIRTRQEVLDARFTKCGPEPNGVYNVRVTILHVDSTSRATLATARRGIDAYGDFRYSEAESCLGVALASDSKNVLLRSLHAGALEFSGRCHEFGEQVTVVRKALHIEDESFSVACEEGYCHFYAQRGEEAAEAAYQALRKKPTDPACLFDLWKAGMGMALRKYMKDPSGRSNYLTKQAERLRSLHYDQRSSRWLREFFEGQGIRVADSAP